MHFVDARGLRDSTVKNMYAFSRRRSWIMKIAAILEGANLGLPAASARGAGAATEGRLAPAKQRLASSRHSTRLPRCPGRSAGRNAPGLPNVVLDRKSTRLNSSH